MQIRRVLWKVSHKAIELPRTVGKFIIKGLEYSGRCGLWGR